MRRTRLQFQPLFFIFSIFVLAACGGGGTDAPSASDVPNNLQPPPPPVVDNNPPLTGNAGTLSRIQTENKASLNQAAIALANQRYTGGQADAVLDIEKTQRVYADFYVDKNLQAPLVVTSHMFVSLRFPGEYNSSHQCSSNRATTNRVTYIGELDRDANGRMRIDFEDCTTSFNGPQLDGTAYAIIEGKDFYSIRERELLTYYDNLRWTLGDKSYFISGYSHQRRVGSDTELDSTHRYEVDYYLTFSNDQHSILVDTTLMTDPITENALTSFTMSGETNGVALYSDIGQVTITQSESSAYDNFTFLGANRTKISQGPGNIKYEESDNNGTIFVRGAYFENDQTFVMAQTPQAQVYPIDILSFPPRASTPQIVQTATRYSNQAIEASPGSYSDIDTPRESLSISYRWYVNGDLINDIVGAVFPPNTATVGDTVSVAMVVMDNINTVESQTQEVIIEPQPLALSDASIPSSASLGDEISFVPLLFDPDGVAPQENLTHLISGPIGASIDSDGVVTWQVPTKQFFGEQTYRFTFAENNADASVNSSENPQNLYTADITVHTNTINTIVTSSVTIDSIDTNVARGDFIGDGTDQFAAQQFNGLTVNTKQNDEFVEDWVYPYTLFATGNPLSIFAVDVDDDEAHEILSVSSRGASILHDLTGQLRSITDTGIGRIQAAIVLNADAKKQAELVLLTQESHNEFSLNVIALDGTYDILHTIALGDIDTRSGIELANVDSDDELEIILRQHTYVNISDWSVHSLGEEVVGDNLYSVASGDFFGSNTQLFAVLHSTDTGDYLSLFESETHQLIHQANLSNYAVGQGCELKAINIDNDDQMELFIRGCQNGLVSILKYINGAFTSVLDSQLFLKSIDDIYFDKDGTENPVQVTYLRNFLSSGLASGVIEGAQVVEESITFSSELENMETLGWLTDSAGLRQVGFMTELNHFYMQLGVINEDRSVIVEETNNLRFRSVQDISIGDFNNDNLLDIFTQLSDPPNQFSAVLDFPGSDTQWQRQHEQGTFEGSLGLVLDANTDGYDDYLTGTNRPSDNFLDYWSILTLYDVQHDELIGSLTMAERGFIKGLNYLERNNNLNVVVHQQSGILLIEIIDGQLIELFSVDVRCDLLAQVYSEQHSLVCVRNSLSEATVVEYFDISPTGFVHRPGFSLAHEIKAIAADPSRDELQDLFILRKDQESVFDSVYKSESLLEKVDSSGNVIWRSPLIKGVIQPTELMTENTANGLEILFNAYDYIYWLK
jgi:hypothetical protein